MVSGDALVSKYTHVVAADLAAHSCSKQSQVHTDHFSVQTKLRLPIRVRCVSAEPFAKDQSHIFKVD